MIEIMNSDAVRTARAKGMTEWAITIHYVFRLVLIPLITIIGMQFGSLLSGAVITETLFSWNGLGMLLVNSIQMRDYPITQACIFVIAISYGNTKNNTYHSVVCCCFWCAIFFICKKCA